MADPRLGVAIGHFNAGDWYDCHDLFEELWHETAGPMRPVLQGILQIAVAELHLKQGNLRGATILMGEGLGRLRLGGSNSLGSDALGIDLDQLRDISLQRLQALQVGENTDHVPVPKLIDLKGLHRGSIEGAL